MTKADWDKVEASMSSAYGLISLLCDGYRLTLQTGIYKRKLSTVPYVNGELKGIWMSQDCEERRRFFRPVQTLVWKKKTTKGFSKKTLKTLGIDPAEKRTYYSCEWSFRSLKAHLIKNNTSIELITEAP